MAGSQKLSAVQKRKFRVRNKIKQGGRARLSVHKSGKHIYAQVIDDQKGHTIAFASTVDKDLRTKLKSGANVDAATAVGKLVAERATKNGTKSVVFDRGSFVYHGRIKALAEAARSAGLEF